MTESEFEFVDASKTRRFLNFILDFWLGIQVFAFSIGYIGSAMGINMQFAVDHPWITGWVVYFVYYFGFEMMIQRTPAKFLTATRVIDKFDNRPGPEAIVMRTISRYVPFEPFSFLGNEPTGWHDRWSDTRVVVKSKVTLEPPVELVPGEGLQADRAYTVNLSEGDSSGWISGSTIQQWFDSGKIDQSTWVYPAHTKDWVRLGTILGLEPPEVAKKPILKPEGVNQIAPVEEGQSLPEKTTQEAIPVDIGELTDTEDLSERYRRMPASELVALWETEALDPAAADLVKNELGRRGISLGAKEKEDPSINFDI